MLRALVTPAEELVTTWYGDNGYEEKAPVSSSDSGLITLDGWLKLRVGLSYVAHLCCLRHRLATAFAAKVLLIRLLKLHMCYSKLLQI